MTEPSSRIKPSALPEPTYIPQDPTKKSHARKQPKGHIPRPRNAFILFRCDFVRQKKVPDDIENDHRNISRIAGSVWREMTDEDKAPWVQMAEQEKITHSQVHPGYRYTPHISATTISRRKKRGDIPHEAEALVTTKRPATRTVRRSSSCPSLPDSQSPPQGENDRTTMGQSLFYLPPPIPRVSARHRRVDRTPGEVQDMNSDAAKFYNFGRDYPQDWDLLPTTSASSTRVVPLIHKPSSAEFEATSAPVHPGKDDIAPSFLSLRRPSSCPPGAQRISSAQLAHPSGTSAFKITRDDLSRRPSRIPMYQSSPTALAFPGDQSLFFGGEGSPYVRDLGRNSRPLLLTGPYRVDPPRNLPGWDAALPQPYPWARGWGNNEKIPVSDYMGMSQGMLEGVSKSDLEGISRIGLEGISPVDVAQMIRSQDSETPPPPQFTNPFSSATNSPFTEFYPSTVGPSPSSSTSKGRPEFGSPFDTGGASPALLEDRKFAIPRQFLPHHETLIGELFPRMSLDDGTESDVHHTKNSRLDDHPGLNRFPVFQCAPDFSLRSQHDGFELNGHFSGSENLT